MTFKVLIIKPCSPRVAGFFHGLKKFFRKFKVKFYAARLLFYTQ